MMCLVKPGSTRATKTGNHLLASVGLEPTILNEAIPLGERTDGGPLRASRVQNTNEVRTNEAPVVLGDEDGVVVVVVDERGADESSGTGEKATSKYLDVRLYRKLAGHVRVCYLRFMQHLRQYRIGAKMMIDADSQSDGQPTVTSFGDQSTESRAINRHPSGGQVQDESAHNGVHLQQNQTLTVSAVSRARLISLALAVCHTLMLISAIDYKLAGRCLSQARTLTFQDFQSRVLQTRRYGAPAGENLMRAGTPNSMDSDHDSPLWGNQEQQQLSAVVEISMLALGDGSLQGQTTHASRLEPRDTDFYHRATSWQRRNTGGTGQSSSPSSSSSSSMSPSTSSLGQISGYEQITKPDDRNAPAAASNSYSLIGTNMCYYLLIVTLVDFFANKDWRQLASGTTAGRPSHGLYQRQHCRQHSHQSVTPIVVRECAERAQPARRAALMTPGQLAALARWLGSAFLLLAASPRHLFQFIQVALLMIFPPNYGTPLGSLSSLMSPLNALNQTVKFGLCAYEAHCHLKQIRTEDGAPLVDQRDELARCNCAVERARSDELKASPLRTVKRYLMISQISHLKMTIMALLIHLDSTPAKLTVEYAMLIVCLVQTFHVMFLMYNEYHTLYFNEQDDGETIKHKFD